MAPASPHSDPGVRIIHVEDLKVLLEDAAQKGAEIGARRVLKQFGIDDDDEEAEALAQDIRDMRLWFSAWRSAKRTAFQTAVSLITKLLLAAFIAFIAWKLGLKWPADTIK